MADPKLTSAQVRLIYRADDGYRNETGWSSFNGAGTPQSVLLEALEELARITALFGLEVEAAQRFHDARVRVADWRREQAAANACTSTRIQDKC